MTRLYGNCSIYGNERRVERCFIKCNEKLRLWAWASAKSHRVKIPKPGNKDDLSLYQKHGLCLRVASSIADVNILFDLSLYRSSAASPSYHVVTFSALPSKQ